MPIRRKPPILDAPMMPIAADVLARVGRVTDLGAVVAAFGGKDGPPAKDDRDPNRDPNGDRGHDREPEYKPQLVCRAFAGDAGFRPFADPNQVFWESPDIWIAGPSGDPDQATPGVVNQVFVHVWNLGTADAWSTHIDLYWCDPSTGVLSALATPIGSTVTTVYAGGDAIVSFPWTPVMVNGGHECLVAHVYDPLSDPLVAPFNTMADRHVGQRNVSVVEAAPGQALAFVLSVENLSMLAETSRLEITRVSGAAARSFTRAFSTEIATAAVGRTRLTAAALDPVPAPLPKWAQPMVFRFRDGPQPLSSDVQTRIIRTNLRRDVSREIGVASPGLAVPRRGVESLAATELVRAAPVLTEAFAASRRTKAKPVDLTVEPRMIARVAIGVEAPRAAAFTKEVYRIVERTNGRVSGGVTVIVKPKAR